MRKRIPPKRRSLPKNSSLEPLRAALGKRTKGELIDLVLEWAKDSRTTQRELESRFGVEPSNQELLAQTRQAIADATDFDESQVDHNFEYDYGAYETVARNFGRLVKAGQLAQAMELSLELMHLGSYQVEMSDEGLMTEDIESCLRVVLRAVGKSKLPPARIAAWCSALQKNDCVGFILDDEVNTLRNRFSRE